MTTSKPKTALVTGASEGIGRAFCIELARQGWRIIAVARNEVRLKSLINELSSYSKVSNHLYQAHDLSDKESVEALCKTFEHDDIELLVNNAGFSYFGEYTEQAIDQELDVMQVNCLALMQLAHAFLQQANKGDALINLSSVTHYLPTPIQATYVASKSFIASFSESLWYQQRKKGVYVQALLPGVTKTEFIARAGEVDKAALLDLIAQTPEQVVNSSLKALKQRRKMLVVPGFGNKLIVGAVKLMPRRMIVGLAGRVNDLA